MTAPPPPARRDGVVDTLHGVDVPDPYRWLEDGDAADVHEWVAAQNARTRQALDARPDRGWWHERLVALMQLPVVMAVQVRERHLFSLERPAGAEQFVLTRRSASDPDAAPVVLVDPAVGTVDAANAVDWYEASTDGALVAVGTSEGGTEDSVLRVLDTADGHDLGEAIPSTRACSVAWEPDRSGFVYTRYPEGDQYHRTVHHHRLGERWEDDPVLWAEHPNPQAWPSVTLSPDGAWLLVHVQVGWARVDVHLLERATGTWTTIVEGVEANSGFQFAADGAALVGVTTIDAPRGRVVWIPLDAVPASPADWATIVDEGPAVVSGVRVWGDELLVVATTRAVDSVRRYAGDGRSLGPVDGLGDVITVNGLAADRSGGPAFVVVDSFDAPTAVWRVVDGQTAERWSAPLEPTSGVVPDLTVSHVEYESPDGTPVGLFLIHRSDVVPGPDVPAILNGYGGFAISETPVWSPQIASWCLAGGTYAIAGLRGGLEEGEAWHQAGRRAHKQNVFDDFHAAADWLVARGHASRRRLAVHGGSNGGLLVGVAMTQRPDLCRAVWCRVPLLDMVRFPRFLIAQLWTSEYGDPE
ncbi:MAG: prolyl oligopeptidase family serine peptidase, partial [Ilumatobacteraceae bacterium]